MTHRSQIRVLGLFLVLILLSNLFLFGPIVHAENSSSIAMLEIGPVVNDRMKALAVNTIPEHEGETLDIKAVRMADALPDDFVPSEANIVSSFRSNYPIYIFFENENDAGILYFYTDAATISMNPYSAYMFFKLDALTDISDIADWDTSNVTNMCGLFSGAKSLPDALAIRNWDTSNVTDMSYGQLREINGLENLDVSKVTDMTCMFYGCGQMTSYDISQWNVSKVESLNHMFCDNHSLVSLDLSKWDVSNVKTICDMFDDCISLKAIGDVSHWNTINLIDAGGWLNGATSFVGDNSGTLDLSGWDTSKLKSAGEMFRATIKLQKIDLSGWNFDSIINERWEGAGRGIYYETGNDEDAYKGLSWMFNETPHLKMVYISQLGLESFDSAVKRGVNIEHMKKKKKIKDFTIK